MKPGTIDEFHRARSPEHRAICDALKVVIDEVLPEAEGKIWHSHPVWFLNGNPVVGYSKPKDGVRLMFWSGASFGERVLKPGTGKFKDASVRYRDLAEIDLNDLRRWLAKSRDIQWDYKNIYKRKGRLVRVA